MEKFGAIFLITAIFLGVGYLSSHIVFAYPSIQADPTCGPGEPGFNVTVSGNGFAPNINVSWKLVDSHQEIPIYGYFKTDSAGSFNDVTLLDQLNEGNYYMAFANDANNDNRFDKGAPVVWTDITIPCRSGNVSNNLNNSQSNLGTGSSASGDLILLSQRLKIGSAGYDDVIGEVKNVGNDTATSVKIGLTTYDKNGGVLGTDETYARAQELKPGQKSAFDIFTPKNNFNGMGSYQLSIQWDNSDGTQGYVENAQIPKQKTTK